MGGWDGAIHEPLAGMARALDFSNAKDYIWCECAAQSVAMAHSDAVRRKTRMRGWRRFFPFH